MGRVIWEVVTWQAPLERAISPSKSPLLSTKVSLYSNPSTE